MLRKDNRIMLLLDKQRLSKTNLDIMNRMNLVYPNDIVCINNEDTPFDYEELYESNDGLKLKNDPYFYRECISFLNKENLVADVKKVTVMLTPERLRNNVYQYVEDKKQGEANEDKCKI